MAVVRYDPNNTANGDALIPTRPKSARDTESSRTTGNPPPHPRRMLSMKSQSQSAKPRSAVPIRLVEIYSGQPHVCSSVNLCRISLDHHRLGLLMN